MRLRLVPLIALVCIAALPARASDAGAGCGTASGKTYTTSALCRLVFRGSPITIIGDAQSSGTTTVRVWITIEELEDILGANNATIVECSARGAGYASCHDGIPDESTSFDNNLLQQFHLRCHVQSNGVGTYRCVSGTGR
jgi:hypothetical protein